jgi:hypothetical protein
LCLLASWIKRYSLAENKIWKSIIDHKYGLEDKNVLTCSTPGASPFWKGVMWAATAARIGYSWKVGNGKKIHFWENQWFGNCSLAIQYWDVYILANEQNISIADAWDGVQLKISFRRCFSHELMLKWYEIVEIAKSIQFTQEPDALIWKFTSNGQFNVKSMYAFINFKGVQIIDVHAIWKLKVPPKIQFFLWLTFYKKLLTRDNLSKRQQVDDLTCVFCNEIETCDYLFWECAVARAAWEVMKGITGTNVRIKSLCELSSLWPIKGWRVSNMVHAALLRAIWLMRNDLVFNRVVWPGMQTLWRRTAYLLAQWEILVPEAERGRLKMMGAQLEALARAPPLLLWPDPG